MTSSENLLALGSVLHDTYRVEAYLSSGGFGNTYVATHIQFGERVAIKEFFMRDMAARGADGHTVSVTNADNAPTFEGQKEKFRKEARRLRSLRNEHIVAVHDLFDENNTCYYVMDFIEGESLADRLKRTGEPLTEAQALAVTAQVLDALRTSHAAGILHLDLKPANMMVDAHGCVTLIDFGASKQQSVRGGATSTSAVSYTNGFAPREQMEQNLSKFGPWTDFYALGATLFVLLTGHKPPLPSDLDDDRTPDKRVALPLPAGLSEQTRTLVRRLMATSRQDRPQSVAEVESLMHSAPAAHPAAPATDETRLAAPPQAAPSAGDAIRPQTDADRRLYVAYKARFFAPRLVPFVFIYPLLRYVAFEYVFGWGHLNFGMFWFFLFSLLGWSSVLLLVFAVLYFRPAIGRCRALKRHPELKERFAADVRAHGYRHCLVADRRKFVKRYLIFSLLVLVLVALDVLLSNHYFPILL